MKIILCTEFYHDRGGAYAAALDAEWLLRSHGHTVVPFAARHPSNFATPHEGHFVDYRDLRTTLAKRRRWVARRLVARAVWSSEAYRRLRRLVDEFRPDLVHVHNYAYHLTPSVFAAAREASVPVVHTLHDYKLLCPQISMLRHGTICEECRPNRFVNCVRYRCVENSVGASTVAALQNYRAASSGGVPAAVAAFICPSEFLRRKCVEWGWPSDRFHCVPNFVRWVAPEATVDARADRPFLFAGRLTSEKGLATLLRAMRRLDDAELLVAGNGPARLQLESEAPANVSFLGSVHRDRMWQLYRNALAVIVPSEWYENCSLTVLEAFAAGRCVVASNLGGLPEQVRKETGLLFEAGDARALAARLRLVKDRPDLAADWGRAARHAANTRYSPEVHYDSLRRIYDSL